MGKITKEQLAIIDSLTCERLTISEANKTVIQDFENNRNKGLAVSLREEAWEEDANGSVAYYLIKDKEGNALFFFSLKCGALFEQGNEEQLKQNATYWKALERILKNSNNGDQTAVLILEKLRSGKNLTKDDLKEIIKIQSKKNRRALEHLLAERHLRLMRTSLESAPPILASNLFIFAPTTTRRLFGSHWDFPSL